MYIFVCIDVRIIIVIVLYNYFLSISLFSLLFLIIVCEYFIFFNSSMLRTVAAVWVFARGKGTLQPCRIQQDTDLLHIESTVVTK